MGFWEKTWDNVDNLVSDMFGTGQSSARAQADINRDFQERMSNTAWQRGAEDMKKAGINPVLMATGGGSPASTPSGSGSGSSAKGIDQIAKMVASLAKAGA